MSVRGTASDDAALFERDGHLVVPTDLARGPWRPDPGEDRVGRWVALVALIGAETRNECYRPGAVSGGRRW